MKPHHALAVALVSLANLTGCSTGSAASPGLGTSSGGGSSTTPGEGGGADGAPAFDAASWNEDAAPPDGGDTWAGWVQGFVEKYCVHCHDAQDPTGRDFTQLAVVQTNADLIRCGITPASGTWDPSWNCGSKPPKQQFPLPGSTPQPTDAERDRVIAWISAGTP